MENVNKNENAVVIDEQLENVSGGIDASTVHRAMCSLCKKNVSRLAIVNVNNRSICKACAEKLNK